VFGFANSWWTFAAFLALNGLAQSSGWSGNVATMSAWFHRKERGRVMGFWATNFQVGGVVANAVAAWALGEWGFRWSFLTGSVLLLGAWAFFAFNQRNSPADVGLPPLEDPDAVEVSPAPSGAQGSTQGGAPAGSAPSRPEAAQLPMAIAINIGLMGVFYFFVKFIRYAIWSWAPLLLKENYGIASDDAGYLSTTFDVCGIFGVIALGWISDKVFAGRRAKASFFFLLGMVASCVMLYVLGPTSIVLFAVSLGLIGFCLYGPDAIMTSAGAMDVTGRWRGAAVAAGVINGMGSIGSMVQELLLPKVLKGQGVGAVFAVMLASSVCACFCLALLLWRNKRGQADI
jgi:OPA family glycerol-3-phosphate transporter-like MFS transporter